jgi:mannose-6-phosphate isomerase
VKLATHQVEKPWGRTSLPPVFGDTGGRRIGEIWFEAAQAGDLPLLVKYIFTSEKLSIQVHPDDEQARERGLAEGKSECWYILDAEPGATLGLGLREPMSADALRSAALDGSIEALMDWKPVAQGDFFFVPAGTVHAIGAGISLLEFQQNADVTYRLYDYGRPRELHLDDGVAVSRPGRYDERFARRGAEADGVLIDGPHFTLCRVTSAEAVPAALGARRRWVMPLEGAAISGGDRAGPGECLLIPPGAPLTLAPGSLALVGAAGGLSA